LSGGGAGAAYSPIDAADQNRVAPPDSPKSLWQTISAGPGATAVPDVKWYDGDTCCVEARLTIVGCMHREVKLNHAAWEAASDKYVREYQELLQLARDQSSLLETELTVLRPLLVSSPTVVHLQSGHGLDDVALVAAGAAVVIGVDFSEVAVAAAQRRAEQLTVACRYVVAEVPGAPLRGQCADLVYTGKGALIWMQDLEAWANDAVRLLRPSGHLFIYESHPMVPLWTWDEDKARIRADRTYFGASHVNDTFPARGTIEWQWTLGEIINAVISAGLEVLHVAEYAEPFWRPEGVAAAAWRGQLPNCFSLLAQRRGHGSGLRQPRRGDVASER
jgi:SAM-dependent methyltransferase